MAADTAPEKIVFRDKTSAVSEGNRVRQTLEPGGRFKSSHHQEIGNQLVCDGDSEARMGLPTSGGRWSEDVIFWLTGTNVDSKLMALVEQSGHNPWQFQADRIVSPVTTQAEFGVGN